MVGLVLKATRWAVDRVRLARRGLRILLAHRPHDGAGSLNITPGAPACLRKSVKDTGQLIEGDENVLVRLGVTLFVRLAARMHDLMPFSVVFPLPLQTSSLSEPVSTSSTHLHLTTSIHPASTSPKTAFGYISCCKQTSPSVPFLGSKVQQVRVSPYTCTYH